MAKNNDHDEHRPNVGLYIKIFVALMVLTGITVAISKVHLPRAQAIGLGLFVATIKATLVAAFFMHLKGENKLIHNALLITVACALILLIPMLDSGLIVKHITSRMAVAEQHPGGHEAHPAEAHDAKTPEAAPAATHNPAKKAHH